MRGRPPARGQTQVRRPDRVGQCPAWQRLRSRRRGDYLLVLQKPLLGAKTTWRDHGICNRWPEKIDRKIHPHAKPIGLITRLIGATTAPGNLVVNLAAGSSDTQSARTACEITVAA